MSGPDVNANYQRAQIVDAFRIATHHLTIAQQWATATKDNAQHMEPDQILDTALLIETKVLEVQAELRHVGLLLAIVPRP